ncbi:MAG: pilus assembly protein [Rhodospirillales bacterium]|nr:pilus assembly protein [Rhodospirillales bacterium]
MTVPSLARQIAHDRRGNLTIEFALALPLLLVLLLTGIEFTRYVLVNQKVERTSASLADLVAQSTVMTEDGMDNLFEAAKYTMEPFDVAGQGRLIVTSVAASGGPARIKWQRAYGTTANSSEFGVQGAVARLPAGLVVRDGDNVILCEAFFRYEPMIYQGIIEESTIRRYAAFRPRYGSLETIYP